MKVLVTGAGGMLGHDVLAAFADTEVTGLDRAALDITDEAAVTQAVFELAPDLIVNTAAYTDVDGCESDPATAHAVNALGPWWLARAADRSGAHLITVSTDYVFDGEAPIGPGGAPRAWTEFDPIQPINAYGRSKAAGEQLVRETLRRHTIVRTAWLQGTHGRCFLDSICNAAAAGRDLTVVDDQHGSPTFCADLAVGLRAVAARGVTGTLNLVNAGQASWHELAAAAVAAIGLDVEVARQRSSALDRPAPRPAWSVLDSMHARAVGLPELPHWRDGLARWAQARGSA
ncbi:MAG: dTDP-4-dehydrorhamnose reductase [Nitriliruptoraceae bacterium]|nr:dTDP-4-dehydrorhamnose reductase [Nitriliruptoraceae bacterium]